MCIILGDLCKTFMTSGSDTHPDNQVVTMTTRAEYKEWKKVDLAEISKFQKIKFEVPNASRDIHILLVVDGYNVEYEIYIGGYAGSQSALRTPENGTALDLISHSVDEYNEIRKEFYVSWSKQKILVQDKDLKTWLLFKDVNNIHSAFSSLYISTGWNSPGDWTITGIAVHCRLVLDSNVQAIEELVGDATGLTETTGAEETYKHTDTDAWNSYGNLFFEAYNSTEIRLCSSAPENMYNEAGLEIHYMDRHIWAITWRATPMSMSEIQKKHGSHIWAIYGNQQPCFSHVFAIYSPCFCHILTMF